jgi:hypothetical protein
MKLVRNLSLMAAGLLCMLALLHWVVPEAARVVSPEMRQALKARGYCQVLFVGPSYIGSHFLPEAFDDEARRIGLNVRACKLGKHGLRGYEMRQQIQLFLSGRRPKLQLLVLDITMGQHIGFESGNWFKSRTLEWHTWQAIPWLASYYRRDPREWSNKLPEIWSHLEHVAAHYLLLGRGTELFLKANASEEIIEEEEAPEATSAGIHRRGLRGQHRGYARTLKRLIQKRRANYGEHRYADSGWPLELREVVRAYGLEAYFLYAPVLHTTKLPRRAVEGEDRLVFLDFSDPLRFPELYRESVRGHTNHLGGEGFEIYSRLLARELKQRWSPKRCAKPSRKTPRSTETGRAKRAERRARRRPAMRRRPLAFGSAKGNNRKK